MIRFVDLQEKPSNELTREIVKFYAAIFEKIDSRKFEERIFKASDLLINLAFYQDKIVGCKIGYKIESRKFYSWLGGVDEKFRGQNIAVKLMNRQHVWCAENNYEIVQTKTKNSFKSMLILNIKSGFDVVDVYRDSQNELKIVLEKKLRIKKPEII